MRFLPRAMTTLELWRISTKDDSQKLLEARHTSHTEVNKYFIEAFGDDRNFGVTNALSYVGSTYGGGKYRLKMFRDGKYAGGHTFEIGGIPRQTYISPFTGEMC